MLKALKYSIGLDEYHVFIESRGEDSWAVVWMGSCMDLDGAFNDEPSPSNRDENFIKNHRFSTPEEAYQVFKEKSNLVVNGKKLSI